MTTFAPKFSIEEYLVKERQAEIRSEYLAGQIITMSGASLLPADDPRNFLRQRVRSVLHAYLLSLQKQAGSTEE